jgi:hypothetical protein
VRVYGKVGFQFVRNLVEVHRYVEVVVVESYYCRACASFLKFGKVICRPHREFAVVEEIIGVNSNCFLSCPGKCLFNKTSVVEFTESSYECSSGVFPIVEFSVESRAVESEFKFFVIRWFVPDDVAHVQ